MQMIFRVSMRAGARIFGIEAPLGIE